MGEVNILIIEEHVAITLILRRVITFAVPDAKVTSVFNAEEALDKLRETKFSVVLQKINTQDWNWGFLLTRIKRQHPKLPVLMLVAGGDEESTQEAYELGASGALSKPFTGEDLRKILTRLGLA